MRRLCPDARPGRDPDRMSEDNHSGSAAGTQAPVQSTCGRYQPTWGLSSTSSEKRHKPRERAQQDPASVTVARTAGWGRGRATAGMPGWGDSRATAGMPGWGHGRATAGMPGWGHGTATAGMPGWRQGRATHLLTFVGRKRVLLGVGGGRRARLFVFISQEMSFGKTEAGPPGSCSPYNPASGQRPSTPTLHPPDPQAVTLSLARHWIHRWAQDPGPRMHL